MSETETITLSSVITQPEFNQLIAYLNCYGEPPHNHILDWLAQHPAVIERMNRHNLLITYFAYLLEAFINEHNRK